MHTLQLDSHVRSFVDFSNASLSAHSEIFPVWQNITIYMLYLESLLLEWKWKWKWSPQSYLTLCDPMDGSPPGSSVHGIFQVRILERVCHFLFQVTFPTQGFNLRLLHWQVDSLPLSLQGSPPLILSNIILSYGYTTFCLLIHLLMVIWAVPVWGYWESSWHKHWQFFLLWTDVFISLVQVTRRQTAEL